LRDAALVYGLVVPPTVVLLVALIPFRDPENANTLLRLLADEFDAGVFAAVVFSAVVAAPLAEEMIFRVILQPTLTRFFDMRWAVVVTAVLFASIHGPYDAVPLLPLSLALGWLYAVRGSVASVVLLHMIFNAVFLAFALLTT
ncbi:MAG: CPBP family intramembrane glutamic endopeptidase, partial [Planctomycetota bacterium]